MHALHEVMNAADTGEVGYESEIKEKWVEKH